MHLPAGLNRLVVEGNTLVCQAGLQKFLDTKVLSRRIHDEGFQILNTFHSLEVFQVFIGEDILALRSSILFQLRHAQFNPCLGNLIKNLFEELVNSEVPAFINYVIQFFHSYHASNIAKSAVSKVSCSFDISSIL